MELTLADHVRDKQKVNFKFYRQGTLYYETEKGLLFEVPIDETGNGVFNSEEHAINFMKWIRKQMAKNDKAMKEGM